MTLEKRESQYLALSSEISVPDILRENLGEGANISPFNLDRVKIPPQGGKHWMVPDLEKGEIPVPTLTGVLLYKQYSRGYWPEPFGQSEAGPPQCQTFTMNGIGVGDPGGACSICPHNQWGSARDQAGNKTSGKACQEKQFLFFLRHKDILPMVLQVPATSLGNFNRFMLRLGNNQTAYWQIEMNLGLEQDKVNGFPISRLAPSMSRRLDESELVGIKALIDQVSPLFTQVARAMNEVQDKDLDTD